MVPAIYSIIRVQGPFSSRIHNVRWLFDFNSKAKFLLFFFGLVSVLSYSDQSIFSSIIRNNLNRYLKNPLFTKSFVRNSAWPNEQDDYGSTSALISPHNGQINEFIKSQNKFASEHHLMEPFGSNYNFDLMSLNNEFLGINTGQSQSQPLAGAIQSGKKINSKLLINQPIGSASTASISTSHHSDSSTKAFNRLNGNVNKTAVSFFDTATKQQAISKSLTVSDNKVNAYSDSNKLKHFNKHSNLFKVGD